MGTRLPRLERLLFAIAAVALLRCLLPAPFAFAEEMGEDEATLETGDEFVPVDPAERETVSGKNLMLGAYGVIFIVLAGYTAALWRRERRLEEGIARLARRTGSSHTHR